jgi:LPS O-antigen subunit length determinant protein (WzzB/FepE family)
MKKNLYSSNKEIDIFDLLKKLHKDKKLITFTIIIFALLFFFYASFKPQNFKTEIKVKYDNILSSKISLNQERFENDKILNLNNFDLLYSRVNNNFLNLKNLESFIEQSKEFDAFKVFLKSKKINSQQYFLNSLSIKEHETIKKDIYATPTVTYHLTLNNNGEFNGSTFLEEYLNFVITITINQINNSLINELNNKVSSFEKAIEIAKDINLESPSPLQNNYYLSTSSSDDGLLFYRGEKVLRKQILFLKKNIEDLKNNKPNANDLLKKQIISQVTYQENIYERLFFTIYGILFGFFFTLPIIFIKHKFKI